MKNFFLLLIRSLLLANILVVACIQAQTTGTLTGTVHDAETKETIPNVNVRLKNTSLGAASDVNGRYIIERIPPGIYTVLVSSIGYESLEATIQIQVGGTVHRNFDLKPSTIQVGEVVVYGASLRRERITDAPAAATVIDAKEIARNAGHGQLPHLLASDPGVDIVQSGMFDFNVNTRGFNSSLNRRLLVLLDGRDLAIVLLGAQEWNGLSIPIEDLGRIEVIRGPGSALYGANAYNGVINITTPSPRTIFGTKAIAAVGNRSSLRADLRHAGIYNEWSYKINIGHFEGLSWSQPRPDTLPPPVFANGEFEYEGLSKPFNAEARQLNEGKVMSTYGSARIDYDFENGAVSTLEGGTATVQNEVYVTGIGRVQVTKASKPWGRLSYSQKGLYAQLWFSGRNSDKPQYSLGTGLPIYETSRSVQGEVQYNFTTMENKLFVVLGASHRLVSVDTENPNTRTQSLLKEARTDNMSGILGQAEYRFQDNLKTVLAARWDRSSLHESQLSPKAAVVWSPWPAQTFRLTFNQAFQAPNYSELFLNVFHPFRDLAFFGNPDLRVEKITGYEFGYKGIFVNAIFLTADLYYNKMKDFITDLAGGVNPKYPREPIPFPNDTRPKRSILSYGNAGKVDEWGYEIGANYYLSNFWSFTLGYSALKYTVLDQSLYDVLLPNAPDYKLSGGVAYTHPSGIDLSVRAKYVPSFPWAAGIYAGTIKAYTVVDLSGTYIFHRNTTLNLNVTNLLNNLHYEIFGGSLLGRRAMVTVTASL